MPREQCQTLKVEQFDEVGQVIAFPNSEIKAVPQPKKGPSPNQGYAISGRSREHLLPSEVETLLSATKKTGRSSLRHRNYTLVLMIYRHGLRAKEASNLRWTDVDFDRGLIFVDRAKGSEDGTHFLQGDELRALRKLQREAKPSPYVFGGMAETAISTLIKRLGGGEKGTLLGFPIHAHMLRHACGYYLAEKGTDLRVIQSYLGHKNVQNTVRYTKLSPNKFKGLWD